MAYGVVGAVASLAVILIGALASPKGKKAGRYPRRDRFAERIRDLQADDGAGPPKPIRSRRESQQDA